MTRRPPRGAPNAVVALLALVLASAILAAPGSAAADPHKPLRKHAAKRHVEKRVSPGLRAVRIASKLTGIPYRWGGASPGAGFDCSGLVRYVYGKVGIDLPHYAAGQYGRGRRISRHSLRAGDLVFFSGLGHVGIYAGAGKFIHAPRSGTTVRWSRLSSHASYYGATRLFAA
ncbi:MAG TPA: C40 family peptidase [Gaiellaceae bacterium]|nr:C40 family peptidase [Gaiellaceae bacterium]